MPIKHRYTPAEAAYKALARARERAAKLGEWDAVPDDFVDVYTRLGQNGAVKHYGAPLSAVRSWRVRSPGVSSARSLYVYQEEKRARAAREAAIALEKARLAERRRVPNPPGDLLLEGAKQFLRRRYVPVYNADAETVVCGRLRLSPADCIAKAVSLGFDA